MYVSFFNYCLDFTELTSLAQNISCEKGELEASYMAANTSKKTFFVTSL